MSNINCEKEMISILREYLSRALRCISIPVPDWEGYYSNIKNIINIAQSSISDTDNYLMSKDDADWVEQYGDVAGVRDALSNDNAIVLTVINKLWPNGAPNGIAGNEEIAAELDRRLMPPGMEWLLNVWPKWSNGEYCKFGDLWVAPTYGENGPKPLRRLAILSPEQLKEWGQEEGDDFGYEWGFIRPSDTSYRPHKVEATHVCADRLPIEKDETVYLIDGNGTPLTVVETPIEGCYQSVVVRLPNGVKTAFDPPRLTHTKPERLEAFVHGDSQSYI